MSYESWQQISLSLESDVASMLFAHSKMSNHVRGLESRHAFLGNKYKNSIFIGFLYVTVVTKEW